jgi:hypothetical protein
MSVVTMNVSVAIYFYPQWLFLHIQGPGFLFSSVIIFHKRYDSLDEWSALRKASS